MLIVLSPAQVRGASRGDPEVGQVRRLRGCLARIRPGGPGQPSGPTTRACLQWLDVTRTREGESPPGREGANAARRRVGKHGPGDRNRRHGAPRGARVPEKGTRQDGKTRCAARRSIPLAFLRGGAPSSGTKERQAFPAPRQRTRAAERWLFDNQIGRDEARGRFDVMRGLDPRIHDEQPRNQPYGRNCG